MYKRIVITLAVTAIAAVCAVIIFGKIYPLKYLEIVEKNAETYGLDAVFICSVIHAESRFNKDAVSKKGASGLMQISKITADWAAEELHINNYNYKNIHDPEINILIGCWYLNKLNAQFDGVTDTVLAAYNAGSGNVSGWLTLPEYSSDGKNLYNVPFGETREYIKKVNENLKIYGFLIKLKSFL